MSRLLFVLVVLSVVAYSVAQQNVQVVPLEADAGVPVNPGLVAGEPIVSEARPKRQFGLGFLLGSALGSAYGYPGYGYGYGHGHGYGHYHHHHHGYRRPYGYGGYGYGR
ncbi:shematrin-like protein 1 [Daphnia carinata]|uniref:shematrin-like protein 1 n=1 Tax=Daphnia carinata TaxID=120202 RepID=UPI002580530A|nr:shematrin-like protein 1 [Daphnia carinata]